MQNSRNWRRRQAMVALGLSALAQAAAPLGLRAAEKKPAPPFKFLTVSDLHVSEPANSIYGAKVVNAMNAEGGALALVVGDMVNDGKENELHVAKEVLSHLAMPYCVVRGNHDGKEGFAGVFPAANTRNYFVEQGIHFIAFEPDAKDKSPWQNKEAQPEAMAALRALVAKIPANEPIVFFCHYPLADGVRYQLKNAKQVLALFNGKKLLAGISGHFHGNTERLQNGVLLTTTACASSARTNHDKTKAKGFRVFEVDAALKITTQFRAVPE